MNVTFANKVISFLTSYIQLFQKTLSDQSIKLEDNTARLCGISAMPRPYVRWRAIWIKEILGYQGDELGSSCFEDGKSGGSSSLS